jgi:tryptophan synthase alpha chain
MGMEMFLENCKNTGIDGLIIPDFPPEEYRDKYKTMFKEAGLSNIMLITPQTTEERIREIDDLSEGFIYMVSSYSTTGARNEFSEIQLDYFKRVNNLKLKNPLITGFGISNNKTFSQACRYSTGAIVGSAFVKELQEFGFDDQRIESFIGGILRDSSGA